jgi:hypothetical protein
VIEKRFDADKEIGTQVFEGQIENFLSTRVWFF